MKCLYPDCSCNDGPCDNYFKKSNCNKHLLLGFILCYIGIAWLVWSLAKYDEPYCHQHTCVVDTEIKSLEPLRFWFETDFSGEITCHMGKKNFPARNGICYSEDAE